MSKGYGCECECGSTKRVGALVFGEEFGEAGPAGSEFWRGLKPLEGPDFRLNDEVGVILVCLGHRSRWHDTSQLASFLRGVAGASLADRIRLAWISPDKPIELQLSALLRARPFAEIDPLDASPLVELLENRRIATWFQPIVQAGTWRIWGYECLMRGLGVNGEVIYPGDILQWARQENLLFMLDRVCREMHLLNAGKADLPGDTHIFINFLPTAIYDPTFCLRSTMSAGRRAGVDPKRVVFEVVETEKVGDREHLASILQHYRDHGFRVALDDVGAGYSGIMMLADLRPDFIKIDRELVSKAPHSSSHLSMCRALSNLGHEGGQIVLAEGVETAEEVALMESIGVDLLQGYFFAKPTAEPVRDIHQFSKKKVQAKPRYTGASAA